MKASKRNMRDQILTNDRKILHCPNCGAEYSGNSGDYWYLPDEYIFTCQDCLTEMELVNKIITIDYED